MRTQLTCSGGGTLQTPQFVGPEFWDKDKTANPSSYPAPVGTCPTGTKLIGIDTYIRTIGGSTYPVPIYDKPLVEWDIPTGTTTGTTPTKPALDECYGNLDCTLETQPATGTVPARCLWGGNPVPLSWCEETTTVQLQAQPVTTTTTVVTPTTVPQPSTTSTSTTTTSVVVDTIPDPIKPPPPPDDPSSNPSGDDCISDQTSGLQFGGILSGQWFRALVMWIVAPVYCALHWFFIPEEGWGSLLGSLRDEVETSPTFSPLLSLGDAFSNADADCIPVELGNTQFFGPNRTVDVGLCDNAVITAIWYLLIALALYGLLHEVLVTFQQFRRRDWST